MMDKLVSFHNGESVVLSDADEMPEPCTCDDCLFDRIWSIMDGMLDDMVEDRVFAILDDIFGENVEA